jgi:hypothetical protein
VLTRLSDDEQIVQYIELRNNARVTGGASIDSMSARDIDMDYSDDGRALERVTLNGGAGVAMKGSSGAGRQIVGEALDVRLAPDGAIIAAHRTRQGPLWICPLRVTRQREVSVPIRSKAQARPVAV